MKLLIISLKTTLHPDLNINTSINLMLFKLGICSPPQVLLPTKYLPILVLPLSFTLLLLSLCINQLFIPYLNNNKPV